MLSKPLIYITKSRKANDFLLHVVCYEERTCQLLKFSMSHEVKKGPFTALIIENSQNLFIFLNIFPETNVVLFTYYQR